jgi:hypothetical protein
MKKTIAILVVVLLAPWIVQGQGATYLSNFGTNTLHSDGDGKQFLDGCRDLHRTQCRRPILGSLPFI